MHCTPFVSSSISSELAAIVIAGHKKFEYAVISRSKDQMSRSPSLTDERIVIQCSSIAVMCADSSLQPWHGLCTFTSVPRSTQPSILRGTLK